MSVWVGAKAAGTPIIRLDTNTIVVELDTKAVLTLIESLALQATVGSTGVWLVAESDQVHEKVA